MHNPGDFKILREHVFGAEAYATVDVATIFSDGWRCVDADGCYWFTAVEGGCVIRLDLGGHEIATIDLPAGLSTDRVEEVGLEADGGRLVHGQDRAIKSSRRSSPVQTSARQRRLWAASRFSRNKSVSRPQRKLVRRRRPAQVRRVMNRIDRSRRPSFRHRLK
jgi:hypothetical protein